MSNFTRRECLQSVSIIKVYQKVGAEASDFSWRLLRRGIFVGALQKNRVLFRPLGRIFNGFHGINIAHLDLNAIAGT